MQSQNELACIKQQKEHLAKFGINDSALSNLGHMDLLIEHCLILEEERLQRDIINASSRTERQVHASDSE